MGIRKKSGLRGLCVVLWLAGVSVPGASVQAQQSWADSVLRTMTLDEKIGQLFMVATFSNKDEKEYAYVEDLVRRQHLGGLIFMQGEPGMQVRLVNRYQNAAKIPLLISQDAEWGPGMRLKNVPAYPKNMTLGAISEDSLLYKMGQAMGLQLRRVGVTMNFAPDVDVNNNPDNPVIGYRSFGENKYNVSRKGIMVSKGMGAVGVIACAKHFPGHGDTGTDSHFDLPLIPHSAERLDSLELYPFLKMIDSGVPAVLVGHLFVPALDPTPNQATTLSPKVVQGILRENMGFQGLIVTDALNMQGVTKYYAPGEVALKALLAGNDILLFPENITLSIQKIREAITSGLLTEADIDAHVHRILSAKKTYGLTRYTPLSESGTIADINQPETDLLRKQLYEAAFTLVKNTDAAVPLRNLAERKIAYVQIGGGSSNQLDISLKKYGAVDCFYLRKDFSSGERDKLLAQLTPYNTVITGVFGMNQKATENFGILPQTPALTEVLSRDKENIVVVFGNPYALKFFGQEDVLAVAYEAVPEAEQAAAAAIFGGIKITGRLPVSASEAFPEGTGYIVRQPLRMGFALPEEVGMDRYVLGSIDSMAQHYVDRLAMPGCAVLVARQGKIVYEKGFGQTEYGRGGVAIDPLLNTYDLASVTKVAATTLCVMHLKELGLLDLDEPIGTYLPWLADTEKAKLTCRRLLQHNAGFPAFIAFQELTYMDAARRVPDPAYYSYLPDSLHSVAVSNGFYGSPALRELILRNIRDADLRNGDRVVYSDLGMILVGEIIYQIAGKPMDECAAEWFYEPLGMNHSLFNPALSGQEAFCPPTESDTRWRNTVVRGYVHDPAAAMLGGVAGHAGLFSNITDLAKLLEMLRMGGVYGGESYFLPETIDQFTRKQLSDSRKGLGWDKPDMRSGDRSPVSRYASAETYGHTGFTGTCVWVDPVWDLTFIFLSNRTYPSVNNRILQREDVRSRILDKVYEAMFTYERSHPMLLPR